MSAGTASIRVCITLLAFACMCAKPVMNFEFNSGAAHHPEGFGAWTVNLQNGTLLITHQVRHEVKKYPPVVLPAKETQELLKLIEAARLEERQDPEKGNVPDRAPASFTFPRGAEVKNVKVWVDWDRTGDPVVKLIRRIAVLIEKHTGVKPVLAG